MCICIYIYIYIYIIPSYIFCVKSLHILPSYIYRSKCGLYIWILIQTNQPLKNHDTERTIENLSTDWISYNVKKLC